MSDPLVKHTNTLASVYYQQDSSGPRSTRYRATLKWLSDDDCVIDVVARGYIAEDIDISALTYSASKWDDIGKLGSQYASGQGRVPSLKDKSDIIWMTEASPLCADHHLRRVIGLTEALLLIQFGERREGISRVWRDTLSVATSDKYKKGGAS